MQVLLADDDPTTRLQIGSCLRGWDFEVMVAKNGREALAMLEEDSGLQLAILDWIMPEMSGPQICAVMREHYPERPFYGMLATVKDEDHDIIAGLDAGASDYLIKPVHRDELHARLRVGMRTLELQDQLRERARTLEQLLPICCYCKKIRRDDDYWLQVEEYMHTYAHYNFSHGVCPECMEQQVRPQLQMQRSDVENESGVLAN